MKRKPHKTFLLLTITLLSVLVATAQQRKPSVGRLNASKPTVYISFSKTLTGAKEDARVRLELHNNTRWKIICYLTPVRAQSGSLPIIYKVEDDRRNQVYSNHSGDVVFQQTLLPGKSIPFDVSKEHLKHGYSIYVNSIMRGKSEMGFLPMVPSQIIACFMDGMICRS